MNPPPSLHLRVRRLDPDVPLPAYQSAQAAGMDLHAALPADDPQWVLEPGSIRVVPCGFAMAVPSGFEAQVRPRSGLASRFGITIPNAPGTIDADYRGPVLVPLINLGAQPFIIERHMRIAQMVIAPVQRVEINVVEGLDDTPRGQAGFGSTGW